MTQLLEEYRHLLEELPREAQVVLESSWQEAVRAFSPQGLADYLSGALSLARLGRGPGLPVSFLEEAPALAREVGEAAAAELSGSAMQMASKTSAAVIELIIATAPTAARRLGDGELFSGYLKLLNQLIAQAPRAVRPLLDHLDPLFAQLTLGGLRRWAMWGVQAHRNDFAEQQRYFSLDSVESQAVLQRERRGVLFVDVQRRINMYLRALWGRDFFMRPTSGDFDSREGIRPYVEGYLIHLPDAFDALGAVTGLELYRAAAAHCAAHIVHTREPLSAEALSPLQLAAIGVIEDARVEALAVRDFPGLRQLWARLHGVAPDQNATPGQWLARVARALADPAYADAHPLVGEARRRFERASEALRSNRTSWELGVALAHDLAGVCSTFDRRRDVPLAPYLDDNRYIWEFRGFDMLGETRAASGADGQVRKYVSLMELANEVDVETAGEDAQEVWVLATELFDDEGVSFNAREGKEPVSAPFHYDEWDYQIQLERPSWATVRERRARHGDLAIIDGIAVRHRRTIGRLKYLLDALQPQGVTRIRKLEDGDDVDLNAALAALTDIRMGIQPDPRVMMRAQRKLRDMALLVLLDLSASTKDAIRGQTGSVLDLTREATVLLADAVTKVGDRFALHGFCSDGRHDVQYWRFKDFDEPWGELSKARIAGMGAALSTRMGTAMRHATRHLAACRAAKRLLLVITDGEPADIDVRDPQYLRQDARKAVELARARGIASFCLSLDPQADHYVGHIFGANGFRVLDRAERLPEVLPALYTGLTR